MNNGEFSLNSGRLNNTGNPIKILFIEDYAPDVELAIMALRKEELKFQHKVVCTRDALLAELEVFTPDLVISDYMMPSFNGLQALHIIKDVRPDLPFILCTGSVNEEVAVECMKAGAIDYVTKQHLTRLPFAINEAMQKVKINNEKKAYYWLLRENEEKLQSIFRASQAGIGLVVEHTLIEVNDFFCMMTGYERKDLIGELSEKLFPDAEEFVFAGNEIFPQILERGMGAVETRLRKKDGTIINVILSSVPLDNNDHSKGISFTILDISDLKEVVNHLQESNRSLNTLLSNLKGLVYRCRNDKEFTMVFLSEGARELTGYGPEDLIENSNLSFADIIFSDDRSYVWEVVQEALKEKRHYELTYRIVTKAGEIRWVWEKGEGISKENSESEYLEGFITDITQQHRNEELLKLSEEKYRRIFENVQDVYYETSMEGKIMEVSPSIEVLSGGQFKADELIGRSIYDFYTDPAERNMITSTLSEKGFITDLEISLTNKDGIPIPCSISAKLNVDESGRPFRIIGSLRNDTDRRNVSNALKIAKEKAEMSDRLKTDFLNNISHEVRTPLNGILGFAEIMSANNLSDEEKKESVSMLLESSNRLLNTINNYMDISLVSSGNLTISRKLFKPVTILKKIYDDYYPICFNRKLGLFTDFPEDMKELTINSDQEIFKKILSHFMDNAVKFTESGSIHLGFRQKNESLEFFVKDTGRGISEDSFDIIFERFVKANGSAYKVSEGSGLGLSIAKGMAGAINAGISLISEPGKGSTFFLTMPHEGVPRTTAIIAGNDDRNVNMSSPILVAEDDPTNFYYLNALLKKITGVKIIHAVNGREAIELFRANPNIKLILMDMKMPEIDGFEATRQIKLINADVHIIAVTAYAMSGDEDKILSSGCDGYLSKPISQKSLSDKIAEFIMIEK